MFQPPINKEQAGTNMYNLYLGCYRNRSRPEHWLSYDFTLFYAILSDTLTDSISNSATATPFHILSNLLLTNHPTTSMLLIASLN